MGLIQDHNFKTARLQSAQVNNASYTFKTILFVGAKGELVLRTKTLFRLVLTSYLNMTETGFFVENANVYIFQVHRFETFEILSKATEDF